MRRGKCPTFLHRRSPADNGHRPTAAAPINYAGRRYEQRIEERDGHLYKFCTMRRPIPTERFDLVPTTPAISRSYFVQFAPVQRGSVSNDHSCQSVRYNTVQFIYNVETLTANGLVNIGVTTTADKMVCGTTVKNLGKEIKKRYRVLNLYNRTGT